MSDSSAMTSHERGMVTVSSSVTNGVSSHWAMHKSFRDSTWNGLEMPTIPLLQCKVIR